MTAHRLPKRLHPDFRLPDRQPQCPVKVDEGNALARGVIFCAEPVSNTFYDVVTGRVLEQSTPANALPKFNKRGRAVDCAVSREIAVPEINFAATDEYSITWLAAKDIPAENGGGMICGDLSGTSNFLWMASSDTHVSIRRDGATTTRILEAKHGELVWRTVVISSSGTLMEYFAKGESSATTASASAMKINGITSGYNNATFDFNGTFQSLIIHRRALSDREVYELHRDPYQILKPATPPAYFASVAPSGGETLAVDAGSYTLSGSAVSFGHNHPLQIDAGSYTLTGDAVGLNAQRLTATDAGSYTLTGDAVGLTASRVLQADAGSYTLSGSAVSFPTFESLAVDAGSYALTGDAVGLTSQRLTAAGAGSYALTGDAVGLTASRVLQADAGGYTLSGSAVSFPSAASLQVDAGSYALTGAAVGFSGAYAIAADAGSYALTGSAVSFPAGATLIAGAGSYALTGDAVGLTASRVLQAGAGSYALTGDAVGLTVARTTQADAGAYALTGDAVGLSVYYTITADAGDYSLSGSAVTLTASGDVSQVVGKVAAQFKPVELSAAFAAQVTASFKIEG